MNHRRGTTAQPWKHQKRKRHLLNGGAVEMKSNGKGRALYATESIPKFSAVMPYGGIVAPADAAVDARWHDYAMLMDRRVVFPESLDIVGGYIANHSCNPNADVATGQDDRFLVRSLRAIPAGAEITIDYVWMKTEAHPCLCGEALCTGNIGLTVQDVISYEQIEKLGKAAIHYRNPKLRNYIENLDRLARDRGTFGKVLERIKSQAETAADGEWLAVILSEKWRTMLGE
jgi:SET domain